VSIYNIYLPIFLAVAQLQTSVQTY